MKKIVIFLLLAMTAAIMFAQEKTFYPVSGKRTERPLDLENIFDHMRANAFLAITNNLLKISGPGSICSFNGTGIYHLSGAPSGAAISWDISPPDMVAVFLGNGNSCQVARIAASNGLVILTATVTHNGQSFSISKHINVGMPYGLWLSGGCTHPMAAMETDEQSGPCNAQCYHLSQSTWWCAQSVFNATSVSWQKVSSIPAGYNLWSSSSNNHFVSIQFKSASQYVELKTTLTNGCGSVEQYYCFNSTAPCGRLWSPVCKSFSVASVPGTRLVSIKRNADECTTSAISISKIEVFDILGSLVKEFPNYNGSSDLLNLDLSGIKNDFYVVRIYNHGTAESYPVAVF